MDNFCVKGEQLDKKCYELETFDFESEEKIFDILLDLLKSELPGRMAQLKDCDNNPMYISEDAIDIIPSRTTGKFELILNPLSAEPAYAESRTYRTVAYGFELLMSVSSPQPACSTWELLRFKNAVEGLLVAAEFAIDGYSSVDMELNSFTYFIPEEDGRSVYRRSGSYRFTVTVTQYT